MPHPFSKCLFFYLYLPWGSFGQRRGAQLDTINVYAVSLQQIFFRIKMVRKYIKKTNRTDISEESIVLTLNDYRNGNYRSIREAAEANGLKKFTLHFKLKKIRRRKELMSLTMKVELMSLTMRTELMSMFSMRMR